MRDCLPKARAFAVLVSCHQRHMFAGESCRVGQRKDGLFSALVHSAIRCDHLYEHDQGLVTAHVGKDQVGEVFVRFDLEPKLVRQFVVLQHDLIAALAQPKDRRTFQESLREDLNDRL